MPPSQTTVVANPAPLAKPEASQPKKAKPGLLQSWFSYYREYPVMLLPLLLNLLAIGWVLHNYYRPWVTVDALISSRTVTKYVSEDEDSYHEYFPAAISYGYTHKDQEFAGEFEDDKIEDGFWSTGSYADAVVEAKRWKIGDTVPILVDASNPGISTRQKPRLIIPLLSLLFSCIVLLGCASDGASGDFIGGCTLAMLITAPTLWFTYAARLPNVEPVQTGYSVLPYIAGMKDYPSLGYVPQNKLHKFDSFEQLLKEWGRPDDLWIENQDGGRRLTLTYRHLADWSEAWSVDFQVPEGTGSPIPIGAPRKDDPSR